VKKNKIQRIILLLLLSYSSISYAQTKEELKKANEWANKTIQLYDQQKNQLARDKEILKKEKLIIEAEKVRLANLARKLDEDVKLKKRDLEQTLTQVEQKNTEIKTKDESLSAMALEKQVSDILLQKEKLEAENQKEAKKSLIIGLILAGILAILMFYLLLARKKASKVLQIEKDKSDLLLLNILPGEIAEELKNTSKTIARSYDMATVIFADIKNFTKISATLSPDKLIQELDFIFGAFDDIIQKHNIEKIKIIGDCYMCVGGIPNANDTNPADAISAAIEMQTFMHNMKQDRLANKEQVYEVRIGINTGPIVAGVIGSKKFAYDVWGDTVNLASRLEAASEPGKINISEYTYQVVKDKFPTLHRGEMEVKGKGKVHMYFVSFSPNKSIIQENQPTPA
jgi:class 3 adenylate cyclase